MKVFFNASLTGKREYGDYYEKIFAAIEKAGHAIVEAPVMNTTLLRKRDSENAKTAGEFYKKVLEAIKEAECCVFEVSFPSFGIGYEITTALSQSKTIIALRQKGSPKNALLETITDDRFQMVEYEEETVAERVKDSLDFASSQVDTRFNFFISPRIGAYMDWVAKKRKTPRAVFLRQLIEDDMKEQGYGG